MFKYIISSHLNQTLSGVAKFNQLLAQYLELPCIGFREAIKKLATNDSVFISVKLIDCKEAEHEEIKHLLQEIKEKKVTIFTFFHTFNELPIEYDLLSQSDHIFCANSEIHQSLNGFNKPSTVLWCPYLVNLSASIHESKFNIFSFGMAHKLQLQYYQKLNNLLQKLQINYSLWISTAFHEKANFGDFSNISSQLSKIYKGRIQYLGFLSDEAINYFISKVQLFVAFFPKGVRANNTSVYVPMEKGCAVLTNLDHYSPKWMKHGVNILDINYIEKKYISKIMLKTISSNAKRDVKKYTSWTSLINIIKNITK